MRKIRMKTLIVNKNTPDLADDQRRQIELMSEQFSEFNNEIIIHNCVEEPFLGKLHGHYQALQKNLDKAVDYYWFNHPDLSFAVDRNCLKTLLRIMEENPNIAVISPVHNGGYINMHKEGAEWHPVSTCDYLSLLIRGDVVNKIGFLNPVFKYSWGAIHEYSYKVYKNNLCIAYCDAARMHHYGGTTYGGKGVESREEYVKKAKKFAGNYFISEYGQNWDSKFTQVLPKGVISSYPTHRKIFEESFIKPNKINNKKKGNLKRLMAKIIRVFGFMKNFLYQLNLNSDKEKKLHLGCGKSKREGWINIDVDSKLKPDIVASAVKLNMFKDCSTSIIEACHLLEHLTYDEAENALDEWFRVLKDNGKLYLELPDLRRCIELLCEKSGREADWFAMIGLYGDVAGIKKDGMTQVHKYGWTFEELERSLKKAGFREINKIPITQTWRKATKYKRDMRIECIK
ncbi:MAG: methyltransferase domain-containing protein [Candidatus Margulisbacteria bacterium]|nr:methyltransferase domain-containing protein [Candidatus Margulisiibacteriota bacterium]